MAWVTATAKLRVWKRQSCEACGATFQYQIERTGQAQRSATFLAAKVVTEDTLEASRLATNTLTAKLRRDVDPHPCPSCGSYQHEMIAALRVRAYAVWVELACVALVVSAVLGLTDLVPNAIPVWVSAALAIYLFVLHWRVAVIRPNADLEANKSLASSEVVGGVLKVETPGTRSQPEPVPVGGALTSGIGRVLIGVSLAAVLLVGSSEFVRIVQRWPSSSELYPPVIGPGDTTTVFMNQGIASLAGYWRGLPSVHTIGAPAEEWRSSTNQVEWGEKIYADNRDQNKWISPWVKVWVPDQTTLASKTVTLEIDIDIQCPVAESMSHKFHLERKRLTRTVDVTLAPRGAGFMYRLLWLWGVLGGGLVAIVATLLLQRRERSARQLSTDSAVFPIEGPANQT
jgi:hypothetical protein